MTAFHCAFPDRYTFLLRWAKRPLRVGAIMPSGKALARLITSEISATSGPVLELGPGTGVFTRALVERGVREADLTLIENDPAFSSLLEKRHGEARILALDAARLAQDGIYTGSPVGAVVSGLPLLSMPAQVVADILEGTFSRMGPGAHFYQFTYGLKCPVSKRTLDALGLTADRIGWTWRNLPPAAVYRISRAER